MTIILDTREPDPHPWTRFAPENVTLIRGTLETGDFALAALPDGVVIERKTPADLAGCVGSNRERFERELKRSRYCGRFVVVCEGTLADVCTAGRSMHHSAIVGTVAAWSVRFCPIIFAGTVEAAADFSFRCLRAQVRDIERTHKAVAG